MLTASSIDIHVFHANTLLYRSFLDHTPSLFSNNPVQYRPYLLASVDSDGQHTFQSAYLHPALTHKHSNAVGVTKCSDS